ncbi:MAG: lipoyl(octanoyl) transferase LipB [Lysobacterales bacterium]
MISRPAISERSPSPPAPVLRRLGRVKYEPVWRAMQDFTDRRDESTPDEIWVLQHPAVFTLGQAGRPEHLLAPGEIPVIQVDRGGQVTFHGPGQAVVYPLVDLRRLGIGVRDMVERLEQAVIDVLAYYGIEGAARRDAPGVYVEGAKIAALGLRVRRGCSFHGLAFNIDMNLEPFERINPCGYEGLKVTQLNDLVNVDPGEVEARLLQRLMVALGYNDAFVEGPSNLP